MPLNKIVNQNRVTYTFTNRSAFNPKFKLDTTEINKCSEFAYAMSFGSQGQHRANRTGGQNKRRNGEIFCDAFNGKLGEFAVHHYFAKHNIYFPEPDLSVYNLGQWDDTDFLYNGRNIAIKTTKSFGNLLLLEKNDWDQNGCYIPNYDSPSGGNYDAIILVRINSDIDSKFKNMRKYFSDSITNDEMDTLLNNFSCSYDIPGYVSMSLLQGVIAKNQIIEQGSYLGQNTRMDATNYYIQSGNLIKIDRLVTQLSNNT